ncbi:MAG: 30S ribosomal protein S12 methylthiotransferase RimO, partial [Muribaculaceae bacterium]|nr:30S ribosomal protein S12 methylthiotransferase RimO [Muribaculaceae bacterium]
QRFERMGAFAYCEEEGTFAARSFADEIPQEVKQRRLDTIMQLQQDIAFDTAHEKIGKTLSVIIDEFNGVNYVGRTEFDSPEVDCVVIVDNEPDIEIGAIYQVDIYDSEGFDLIGRIRR